MNATPIPIVRLEVEQMKHSILMACSEYAVQMDADIQAAVEEACKPEHISAVIRKYAHEEIDNAIKEEIKQFYRYGDGRKVVKEVVGAMLSERLKEDPND